MEWTGLQRGKRWRYALVARFSCKLATGPSKVGVGRAAKAVDDACTCTPPVRPGQLLATGARGLVTMDAERIATGARAARVASGTNAGRCRRGCRRAQEGGSRSAPSSGRRAA